MKKVKISLCILLVLSILLAACSQKKEESGIINKRALAENKENFSNIDYAKLSAQKVDKRTIFDNIETAFQAKKITQQKRVALFLKAYFEPDLLPEEYKSQASTDTKFVEINDKLQWGVNNLNKLSAAEKEEILPYVVSPQDPKSYLNRPKNQVSLGDVFFPKAYAAETSWHSVDIIVGGKEVGYVMVKKSSSSHADERENNAIQERKAKLVKNSMEKAYPMYKALLGVEPKKVIVHITEFQHSDNNTFNGTAIKNNLGEEEVKLDDTLDGERLEIIAIHELFHCFQYELPILFSPETSDRNWLLEATAVWAQDLVYPANNFEHSYLEDLYSKLDKDLIQYNNTSSQYGGYILFYYLTKVHGNNYIVRDVLKASVSTADIRYVLSTKINDFEKAFFQFSHYNWNSDLLKKYTDQGGFAKTVPSGTSLDYTKYQGEYIKDFDVKLSKASTKYYVHEFEGNINKVKFNLIEPTNSKYQSRSALIKVGGIFKLENWDNIDVKIFDRSKPQEKVDMVVLIYTNASLKTDETFKYSVDTRNMRIGYTKISGSGMIAGVTKYDVNYLQNDVLEYSYDEYDGDLYVLKERDMSCTYNGSAKMEFAPGMILNVISTGSGAQKERYDDLEKRPEKLRKRPDGKFVFHVDPSKKNHQWVTYTSKTDNGAVGTEKRDVLGSGGLSDFELNEDEIIGKRIKGKRTISIPSPNGNMTATLEFDYELP